MGSFPVRQARAVVRRTSLAPGLFVALPRDCSDALLSNAEAVLRAAGVAVRVESDPSPEVLRTAGCPVLVVGNLADSACAAYLYHKLLCFTDRYYPGPAGFELRTLLDPFATGHNLLCLGYSDDAGRRAGLEALLPRLGATVPFLNLVHAVRLPCGEALAAKVLADPVPDDPGVIRSIHNATWHYAGFLTYLTGDARYLDRYLDGWHKLLTVAREDSAIGNNMHLYSLTHVTVWRMLEYAGLLPDEMRGDLETAILRWARSREGYGYASTHARPYFPSHNHTMFCANALTMAAEYLLAHYPGTLALSDPGADFDVPASELLRAAWDVFASFDQIGGWKPVCDDSSYSTCVTLPLVLIHSAYDDTHAFINESGRTVAAWLKAILDQNGMLPSYGDGSVSGFSPQYALRSLAYWLSDGELLELALRVWDPTQQEGGSSGNTSCWSTSPYYNSLSYSADVVPVRAQRGPGVTAIPLDRLLYDIWTRDAQSAEASFTKPPETAYETTYDKLSLRTGDTDTDDFLLLDGLGSTCVHAYSDTCGVLDYTARGVVWLAQEMAYSESEVEKQNLVTLTCNGLASPIPSYARLEASSMEDGVCYARVRRPDSESADWIREAWLSGGVLVLRDSVVANVPGAYIATSNLRTPGRVAREDGALVSRRTAWDGTPRTLRLTVTANTLVQTTLREQPFLLNVQRVTETRAPELCEKWHARYGGADYGFTELALRASAVLTPGESIALTQVFYVDGASASALLSTLTPVSAPRSSVCTATDTPAPAHRVTRPLPGARLREAVPCGGGRVLCLYEDDRAALLDGGYLLGAVQAPGRAHKLIYTPLAGGRVFAGIGDDMLYAYDLEGNFLWKRTIREHLTEFPSWQLETPRVVGLAACETGGRRYIAAGCGDNYIRVYTFDGTPVSECHNYATVPSRVLLVDVDGDGEPELLGSGERSNRGSHYVHKLDGCTLPEIQAGPWLCTCRAVCVFRETGGELYLAQGMSFGVNLRVLRVKTDGTYETVFAHSLGAAVVGVERMQDGWVAASGNGALLRFDEAGHPVWYADAGAGIATLWHIRDRLAVLTTDGCVLLYGEDGALCEALDAGATSGAADGEGGLYLTCGDRLIRL